jgi:predicted benzoate:H+ symporter BenE
MCLSANTGIPPVSDWPSPGGNVLITKSADLTAREVARLVVTTIVCAAELLSNTLSNIV